MYLFDDDKIHAKLQSNGYRDFVPGSFRSKIAHIEFLEPYLHETYPKLLPKKTDMETLRGLLSTFDKHINELCKQFHHGWREPWKPVIAFYKQNLMTKLTQLGYTCRLDSDGDLRVADTEFVDFSWIRPDRGMPKLQLIKLSLRYDMPELDESLRVFFTRDRFRLTSSYDDFNKSENVDAFSELISEKYQALAIVQNDLIALIQSEISKQLDQHLKAKETYDKLLAVMSDVEQETSDYAEHLGLRWGTREMQRDPEDDID